MVDGPGGRVRPVVAARDGHRPAERGDVPVDGRRHLSAGREPDPDLSAMILAALRGVQSLPQLGIGEAIDLAADVATRAPESRSVATETRLEVPQGPCVARPGDLDEVVVMRAGDGHEHLRLRR